MHLLRRLSVVLLSVLFSFNLNAQGLWSSPSSWPGGMVPVAGNEVTIPLGQTIILDVNPPALAGITVRGTLRFAEVPLHLTTDWIMVMMGGKLEIGTEAAPHLNPARITLTGDDVDVMGLGMGGKFITAMDGGVIELHGISRDELSWSVLDGSLSPGATSMQLRDASTWDPGDKIVLAPSGVDPFEAEELTVVTSNSHTVTFTPPLQFAHFGEIQTINGKQLDMRAEVGLLTRNILIEGNEESETSAFGGHLMIMNGGNGFIEGVEFYRMGQFTKQGRYPCHWHLSGAKYGNYSRFNSVHHSFHRGIVIHGTDGITLQGNVIYDIRSHGYVLAEDGDEEDNIILDNLGILIKQIVRLEDYAFPDLTVVGVSSQSEFRPGVFWMKNPNQVIKNNHAAGSVDGIGFFFDGVGTATSLRPDFFQNNISHSNFSYFIVTVNERYPPLSRGHGLFVRTDAIPGATFNFDGLTAYKNSVSGVWLEEYGQVASNAMLSDNGTGAILMRASLLNSTVIHQSNNTISPPAKRYGAINTVSKFGRKKDHLVDHVNFYGFPNPIFNYEDTMAGPNVSVRNIQVFNSTGPRVAYRSAPIMEGAIRDEDGSLTGSGPSLIFHDSYALKVPSCVTDPANNTTICPMDDYVFLSVSSEFGASKPIGSVEVVKVGGNRSLFYSYESPLGWSQYSYVPRNSRYKMDFISPPMGLLPSLIKLNVKGSANGYVALRIQLDAGNGAYVLDKNDEFIPSVNSLSALQLNQNNYYLDAAHSIIYVVLKQDAANAFKQTVSLLQLPVSVFLRNSVQPAEQVLAIAQPNVVNQEATIRMQLPKDGVVHLQLFDLMGRRVMEWTPGVMDAGSHEHLFNVSDLPVGSYVFSVESNGNISTGKLMIAR
jgi:hypothetical protein